MDSRSSKDCPFDIFEGLKLYFDDFPLLLRDEICPKTKLWASETARMAIPRKLRVAQKSCNLHTVGYTAQYSVEKWENQKYCVKSSI